MSNSRKITLTLSADQHAKLQSIATQQGISISKLIIERLKEEQAHTVPSGTPDLSSVEQELKRVAEQVELLQETIQKLGERPPATASSDPTVRTMLQPVLNRLQQLEHQIGVVGNLTQQNLGQTANGHRRIEIWLEALQTIIEPLLLDYQTEENRQERRKWFDAVVAHLDHHLETSE